MSDRCTLQVSSFLTWMILLKVSGPLPNLEVHGERRAAFAEECIGDSHFGDSLILLLCFYRNGKKWCLVRLWGAKCMIQHFHFLSNDDGLTVSGNQFRRVRDVDMKHDFAFVVRIIYLFIFLLFSYSYLCFEK